MSNNSITKDALAGALKEILKEKPLEKITIKDITKYCNVSRNTFYYHFADKYELVNWIFYTETLKEVNTFSDPDRWLDSFVNLCKYLYENREFYLSAFQYVGQNSLQDYLLEFYYELFKINDSTLYSDMGLRLAEEELALMARMQAHSYVVIIMDWVKKGMNDDYMSHFEQLYSIKKKEAYYYSMLTTMP